MLPLVYQHLKFLVFWIFSEGLRGVRWLRPRPVLQLRNLRRRLRSGGGDDASGGGVHVLRRRTLASADGLLRGLRVPALISVLAGAAISLLGVVRGRSPSAGFGQQGGRGGTLAPAPSDARFVSRLTGSLDQVAPPLTP